MKEWVDFMAIKKISKQRNGMYKIELDQQSIIVHEDLIIKYNILYKKEVDNNILSKLSMENNFYIGYNKALNYLSFRMRSEKEIDSFLIKKEIFSPEKNKIIEKLKEQGYINDNKFKKAFINDKMKLGNYGPLKIQRELSKHNISCSLEDFSIEDEKEKLIKIIDKQIKLNKKYTGNVLKQRIYKHVIEAGFNKALILDELKKHEFKSNNNLEKDLEKIHEKLSKKYTKNNLVYQIKNKLRLLGYNMEEINEAIEKALL